MKKRVIIAAVVALMVAASGLGGLLWASYTGTASAKDPEPTPGAHEACQKMHAEGMDDMHGGDKEQMHGNGTDGTASEGMDQMHNGGMDQMHEGAMDGGSHMGDVPGSDTPETY